MILINALLLLGGIPVVYATTCTSSGGSANSGYYYAQGNSANGNQYGVKGTINAQGWTYYSGTNGHSLLFVNLIFAGYTDRFAQSGVGKGNVQGQAQTDRLIYFEWNDGSPHLIWVTGHPVSDNDGSSAWSFAYQQNGDGSYTFELSVNSPSAGWWGTHPNVGRTPTGLLYALTENAYFNGYNGNCNAITNNSHSNLQYSTAISTSPSWSSWSGSCIWQQNDPYSVNTNGCPTSYSESGS